MTEDLVHKEDALNNYTAKEFRTPDGYTSDMILTTVKQLYGKPKLHILLIKRSLTIAEGKPIMAGVKLADSGGFADKKECADQAAESELEEENSMTGIPLIPFEVLDKPGRDLRLSLIRI